MSAGDRTAGLRFGLSLFTCDRGITVSDAAQAAEEHGFDSFYVPEITHVPIPRATDRPATGDEEVLSDDRILRTLDPWVVLGAAAAVTTRIRIGTSVALPLEHDPITLAKTIATLDHMSGGRVVFGVGFGANPEELADHGIPPGKRRTVLREYLAAMQALWTEDEAAYSGDYVRFGPSWAWPKPPQQPRPPILVGAGGTERTFDWIAQSADGWMTSPIEQGIDSGVKRLREKWCAAGRSGVPRVVVLAGESEPDPGLLRHWRDLGVAEVVFPLPDADTNEARSFMGRLTDQLADQR
ncbi:TIGR03619 family F420-dependent LLM class oxidoreductase [Nocardia rhamnosiphila]|uniref:TIGR03619 family F420-dependent LLM class oxidoreductase n=1 Tax=Nocardia rhamnosiphila TaxID=426716 RepID=UPI0033EF6219